MADTPSKFDLPPIHPTTPAIAPMVQEQRRAAALPGRINSGEAAPIFPPPQTSTQGDKQ